jgi:hypothetical protein
VLTAAVTVSAEDSVVSEIGVPFLIVLGPMRLLWLLCGWASGPAVVIQ